MRLYTDHFAFGARHTAVEPRRFRQERTITGANESAQKSEIARRGPWPTCMNTYSYTVANGKPMTRPYRALLRYCHDYCPSDSAPDDRGKMDDSPRSRSTRAARAHPHRSGY